MSEPIPGWLPADVDPRRVQEALASGRPILLPSMPNHITVPVSEYEQLAAVVEAARAWRRDLPKDRPLNEAIAQGVWQPRIFDLIAAVDALDAPEATS